MFYSQSRSYVFKRRLISSRTQTKNIKFIYKLTQPSADAMIRLYKRSSNSNETYRILEQLIAHIRMTSFKGLRLLSGLCFTLVRCVYFHGKTQNGSEFSS